jgi:hypothetical protein
MSVRGILVRAAAALTLTLAFAVVLQVSIAGEFRSKMPRLALAATPLDGDARAALAASVASLGSSEDARSAAEALALDSLRRSPLNPVALRALGLSAASGASTDRPRALAIMTEAERLSRRDHATQIWLIQYHLTQGDLPAAMRQIDIALRTATAGRDALFALLEAASADPRIARELAARMQARPHWAEPFVSYLVASGREPERTAHFARDYLDPSDPEQLKLLESLFALLSSIREYEVLWDLYSHAALPHRAPVGAAGRMLEEDFESAAGYAPFAWTMTEEGDLWGGRQAGPNRGQGNVLAVAAHSGRSGEAARRLLRLDPGEYRISASVGNVPETPFERQRLGLRCAAGDEQTVLVAIRPAGQGPQKRSMEGRFTIPSSCRYQWLFVAIASGDAERDSLAWVDDIRITRLSS